MKITKKMFKSFEGLEELKKIEKARDCIGLACAKCPLKDSNINGNINNKIACSDIIDLSLYKAKNPEAIRRMDKLINIFTKENINAILAKLAPSRNLKYHDYVVYNNNTFQIKGVIENSESSSLILLNGHDLNLPQIDEQCITNKKSIEKGYNLLVEPSEIFALNDVVIEKESNIEYKIVAIATPDYPILLNDYFGNYLNINDCEDVCSSIPEAHEKDYNKWVVSYNIKHK